MDYQVLTDEEKHDMLVNTLYAQERDHWMHTVNKERYEAILADPDVKPNLRAQVQKLLTDTESRIHEVTHIIEKLRPQLPAAEHIQAAVVRIRNGKQA
jgi:hypothetical protein